MTKKAKILIAISCMAGALMVSSCSSSPSDEELQRLAQLKDQASQLDAKVKEMQRDNASLEKQIADKNAKLQQCQSDQEAVKKALGK